MTMKFVSFARALLIIGVMCVFLIAVCDAFGQIKETNKPASLKLKQKKAKLKKLLTKIDMELYKQSEADVRGLLDKLIEKYWKPGQAWKVNYDAVTRVTTDVPAMWFRGYEMLGDKKFLRAGLDFVDAILQTQRKDGMFPSQATLRRDGTSEAHGRAELQDEYNFVQFALICYAYKLTKDKKYLDAALKHAETLRSCQDPSENEVWQGPWPHTDIAAEELSVSPGLDELSSLIEIKRYSQKRDYDVCVVDCAPTAGTIRLLSLPEVIQWYMEHIF